MTTLTPEDRAELAALRDEEARIEAERVEAAQPWNAPPVEWSGVASTITLFEPPPVEGEVDPIAGPPPVDPEDYEPVVVSVVGPGSLLAAFAASQFAEQHPRDSTKQRLLNFIGEGLGMTMRLPPDPARQQARDGLNRDRAAMGWSPLPEPSVSCDWTTWEFLVDRVTRMVRGH